LRSKRRRPITVYCGVDFHARLQTVSYCNTADGQIHQRDLHHYKDDIRAFYSQLSGEVIVGLETSGYSAWFEQMLEELGHKVWTGDAAEIRRRASSRHKNDRRDADHILSLMLRGEFPRLHRPLPESREALRQLRYRQRLVKVTTMIKNNLQAIAISNKLSLRAKLFTSAGRQRLVELPVAGVWAEQRDQWVELLDKVNEQVRAVEQWLKQQAASDEQVQRLQTQPGVGLLTSLALVHTLNPVGRFATTRKVVAYVGLGPVEHSSAEQKRYGSISKAGCRYLRHLLGEAAQVADSRDQRLKEFYWRVAKRRGKARAIVAVARKLVVASFILLRDGIDYSEFVRRGMEARSSRVYT
jgi:transposase